MSRSTTLAFGPLGRCACGEIGKRRDAFRGEPICSRCLPYRSGPVITIRDVRANEVTVGTLSPSQRRARQRYLRDSGPTGDAVRPVVRDVLEAQHGYNEQTGIDGRHV